MTNSKTTYAVEQPKSSKMLQALVGIGVICALLIVLTFQLTLPQIEKNKAEALEKAIFKVLPGIVSKQSYNVNADQQIAVYDESEDIGQLVYTGLDNNGELKGFVIEASGMGFADIIRILYGYDPENQTIVGFYVLESKETPGLGDKIEKDETFLANFDALDVALNLDRNGLLNKVVPVKKGKKQNPWEVDCITGATISSRAIGNILSESTEYWMPLLQNNKAQFEPLKHE